MSDPDDLPIFRPRFGKRRSTAAERAASASPRNAGLALVRLRGPVGARRAPSAGGFEAQYPHGRRVVVKAHVQRLRAGGAKAASLHLRYIERDGVEKDGSRGVLYGPDGPMSREALEEPRSGERHQFRLIVSPEDAGELDLTAYIRGWMGRVERDLGRKLEWAAVNHHDTAHPHAHVVVRGVGQDGKEVRLDRAYIAKGLRWRAQELATEELGPRHAWEVVRAHRREVTQDRFTSLDREIEHCAVDRRIERATLAASRRVDPSLLVGRLEYLESLGLAERPSRSEWVLAEGWAQQLRNLGARGDILREMHQALRGDPARYRIVGSGQSLRDVDGTEGALVGRVVQKGLSDELKGTFYALVETPTGSAYRIPFPASMAEGLRPGEWISFGTRPQSAVQAVDRRIAEVALAQGGRYVEGANGTNADAERRRLIELGRLGIVCEEANGRWSVPPDLLEQIERRRPPTSSPHRVWVRKEVGLEVQVTHVGAVWLDRVDPETVARYGVGLEVRHALERRRELLRERGREPAARTVAAPAELHRRAVGEGMAARTGRVFLVDVPDGFRGRLEVGPDAAPFAVVSDGRAFIVVPASRGLREFAGRVVEVQRQADGIIRVRGRERGMDR